MIQRRLQYRARNKTFPAVAPYIQERIDWANTRLDQHPEDQIQGNNRQLRDKPELVEWRERWSSYSRRTYKHSFAGKQGPDKDRLKLHAGLRKAESAILIQARTGRIGLAHFLNLVHVPGFGSPECQCERGDETAEHITNHCPLEKERRTWSRGTTFKDLVSMPSMAKQVARWLIQCRRIEQFRLAAELLYGDVHV